MRYLLLCLTLGLVACQKQNQTITKPSVSVPAPRSGPPEKLVLPRLTDDETPEGIWLPPGRVYPLGWSPGGLFAYAYEPADEACGCYFFHLIIQDMVNDKTLWDYDYSSEKLSEDDPSRINDLAAMWKVHGEEFEEKLASFGIVRSQIEPKLLPQRGPDPLAATFQSKTIAEGKSEVGYEHLASYELQMTSARGQKTIFKSGELIPGLLNVSSPGYLQSPFEPRAAILIREQWRGWEGPPSVVHLRFSGCDLERGWH